MVIEKQFEYKGYPCVIMFSPIGYRCGYVGVPSNLKFDRDLIACHGSVTYKSNTLQGAESEGLTWVGFDCNHSFDGADIDRAKELYKNDALAMIQINYLEETGWRKIKEGHPVRTLEYCEEQCQGIVEQFIEYFGGKSKCR